MKLRVFKAFTLVELMIVIVVLAILAGIVLVSYSTWRSDTTTAAMKNDLLALAAAMDNTKNFSNGYPSSVPSSFSPSNGNVVQLSAVSGTYYCATVYNSQQSTLVYSYSTSTRTIHNYPCSGSPSGSPVGGAVPQAPRGTNLLATFDNWTLTGTAQVNASTDTLTLGTNGTATSPAVRVDSPNLIYTGGDLYALQQAVQTSIQPNAAYHLNIAYLGSDGSTAAQNKAGATGNGCARAFPKGGWSNAVDSCSFSGGPNVIYVRITYYSSASGYSSPDLQIKNPLIYVKD